MTTALATIRPISPRAEGLQLRTLDDVMRLGQTFARSGYFQDARDAAQCVTKIIAGAELGFGPMASMNGIHVINGKPSLGANLMAAAIKRSGRYNFKVRELTEKKCRIEFFEDTETLTPESEFTIEDAKKAGLLTGGNRHSWEKYPRNMLFARALSNGAKWHCADVFGGPPYLPEELGAIVDGETGDVIEVKATPINAKVPQDEAIEAESAPVKNEDEGWLIDKHTRTQIFGLCTELEKLGQTESQWRAVMRDVTGVESRRSLTGPLAAKLMPVFAETITKLRSAPGEKRDVLLAEITGLIGSLKDDFGFPYADIKEEMSKVSGKVKRTDLTLEEAKKVRDHFNEWIGGMEDAKAEEEARAELDAQMTEEEKLGKGGY